MLTTVYQFGVASTNREDFLDTMARLRNIHLNKGVVGFELMEDINKNNGWMIIFKYYDREQYDRVKTDLSEDADYIRIQESFEDLVGGKAYLPHEQFFTLISS